VSPSETDPPLSGPEGATTSPGQPGRWGLLALCLGLLAAGGLGLARRRHPVEPPAAADTPHFDPKGLSFSAGFAERIGLRVEPAARGPLVPTIKVVGAVTFHPAYVGAVGARARGFVRRVLKVEGDEVEQGATLAEIQSGALGEAQAEIGVAAARKKAAEVNARREAELLERKLTTAREAEDAAVLLAQQSAALAAARQRVLALGGGEVPGVHALRAPIAGTVVERRVDVGQSVGDDVLAFRVADLDHLWIELAVFEQSLGAVRVGDRVEVFLLSSAGDPIVGRVAHVGAVIDQSSRSADVRVEVDHCRGRLRPGQAVAATIFSSGPAREVVHVPEGAVTFVDGKPTVFLSLGPGRVAPTPVTLGATDGVRQEITGGVAAGQPVVVGGVFELKSELFR
jgi:cobalt-zinc-cadmium efflux system membrane fusion protein